MKDESFVQVKEEVIDNPPSVSVDDTIDIGGVILSSHGPALARVSGPTEFLKTFGHNGAIPRNAHISLINAYYLSHVTPLVLARALNVKLKRALLVNPNLATSKAVQIDENYEIATYKGEVTLDFGELWGTGFTLRIEDLLLYNGAIPETLEQYNLYEIKNFGDLAAALSTLGGYSFSYSAISTSTRTVGSGEKATTETVETLDSSEFPSKVKLTIYSTQPSISVQTKATASVSEPTELALTSNVTVDNTAGSFLIALEEVTNSEKALGKLTYLGSEIYRLRISPEEYYDFSLNPNKVDSAGSNLYIDRLNNFDLGVRFIVLDEASVSSVTYPAINKGLELRFDASTDYSDESSYQLPYISEALESLVQQEVYTIDGLCLFGLQTGEIGSQICKLFVTIGQQNKWFTPICVPYIYKNRRVIANWANNLNLPERDPVPGSLIMGPFDTDTTIVGWKTYIDAGCKYWERVAANKARKMEFAPIFRDDTGIMNVANPAVQLKETDRNLLLNGSKPINWICLNKRTNVFYLNQNWTWMQSKTGSVVEEENICRQIWKISRDVDPILEQFFAKYNNRSTRQQAYDLVDYYFRWNIMNQEFPPEEYRIVCDNTNNTVENIRNHWMNMLVEVRYQGSIKWVKVINRAYPLGVEFNGEM